MATPIRILHSDEHLVVVDKPANLLVVPAPGRDSTANLVDRLAEQLQRRVLAVHRLDEDTTGAIVLALDQPGREGMEALFRRHAVERAYLALVAGHPSPAAGTIRSQLRMEGEMARVVSRGGLAAITHYEVLARRGRCTLLKCRLETGRRNQIRVHMQAIGCPLAGDRKYGFRSRGEDFVRPMLHSWQLAFRHPVLGQAIRVEVMPSEPELIP